ncbi:hypothetical protein [Photobacterium indicum]|uniref:hypothetical protein n=1 Tax=Photobacterium indicum TaxID=81447 RepID=UPI003D0FF523
MLRLIEIILIRHMLNSQPAVDIRYWEEVSPDDPVRGSCIEKPELNGLAFFCLEYA